MDLKAWAELIYISREIKIRDNPSRHQEYIRDFVDLVKEVRESPSDELKQKLMAIKYIRCDGNSEHVVYARYLQHCLSVLKGEGKME